MDLISVTNYLGLTNHQKKGAVSKNSEHQETEDKKTKYPKRERTTLYKWTAPSRPAKKQMNQKTTKTLIVIGGVIALLLVAMQEFFLILVALSLIFVSYMLQQVPAEEIEYEITNHGVKYADKLYFWDDLSNFFFVSVGNTKVVALDVLNDLPTRIFLTLNKEDKEKIKSLLEKHVEYLEEEPKTFFDKAYDSVANKLDLDS